MQRGSRHAYSIIIRKSRGQCWVCAEAKRQRGLQDMGNSFLQDRGASFAQRRAEESLRKARVVHTFALVIVFLLLVCFHRLADAQLHLLLLCLCHGCMT